MNVREWIYCRKMNSVAHATLNPEGPGAVRIHLIPPQMGVKKNETNGIDKYPSVAILNGQYYVPVNRSYAVLLNEFIVQLDKFAGTTITEINIEHVIRKTVNEVHKVYYKTNKEVLVDDLKNMVGLFTDIAYGKPIKEEIGYMSIGDYAPFMRAPHRMDLMISSMMKDGCWNCNQKCLHCYAAGQPEAEVSEISTKQWKDVIDKCYDACIAQVTFTGGEPTRRNDLVELVSYAKKLVTRLNTNGINLTEELCKQLFKASLDCVQITFYSYDPFIHNQLVGAKMYDKTLRGIRNAFNANLNVSINTPLCSINKEYAKTLQFLKELGIQYVTCSGLIITGNATLDVSKNTQLSEEELYEVLKEATKFCAENDMEIAFTSPGWLSEEQIRELGLTIPMCGACLSNMAIAPDGSVVPCQSWLSDEVLGNMITDNWNEIWNSKACKAIRNESAKCNYYCPLRSNN